MELREYWRVFKRRAWIPIVLLVVTVLTAGALAFLSKPEYVATARVQAKATGAGGTQPTQTLSYQATVGLDALAIDVVKQLSLTETPADMSKRIKVASAGSDLYTVSITDPNPEQAVAIANAVATVSARLYQEKNAIVDTSVFDTNVEAQRQNFLKAFQDADTALITFERANPRADLSNDVTIVVKHHALVLEQQAAAASLQGFEQTTTTSVAAAVANANQFSASVLDPAIAKPDTSSRYLKVGYAAALALLLGIGLIYLLEYMDNSVREPEGVEEMIGAPVVGIIPKANPQSLKPARGGAA
ncbi:MAG: protein tyrosine kinase modulator [Chloroflexota bacterium]|jgi:capsular polysaccharide biosynthesis protein|nr:protein tyrosine kinase modulator [Chloroflexota bacterium]